MNQSDEALIAAVAAGDREAFATLYRRRRPDVYRFALHMTGASAAAEDVAQDVFMTVIPEAARYTPGPPRQAGAVPAVALKDTGIRRMAEASMKK